MAFSKGNTILPGYPMPFGEKYLVIFDHTGPTSYTQFGSGTGGDIIKASSLGMGGFDMVIEVTLDTTGVDSVQEVLTLAGYGNAVPQVTLKWFTSAAQTTEQSASANLSTISVRIAAVMV
jgi:hypothetical protein